MYKKCGGVFESVVQKWCRTCRGFWKEMIDRFRKNLLFSQVIILKIVFYLCKYITKSAYYFSVNKSLSEFKTFITKLSLKVEVILSSLILH